MSIPYLPAAGPFVPISALVQELPHLGYQVYFEEETSAAIAELGADIRRTLRSTLRTSSSPPPADFLLSNKSYLVACHNCEPGSDMLIFNLEVALDATSTVPQC
jgi:soluble epoxide hydrolase/lipid-phosphate phosphatase